MRFFYCVQNDKTLLEIKQLSEIEARKAGFIGKD